MGPDICAVILEPMQGSGGCMRLKKEKLKRLRVNIPWGREPITFRLITFAIILLVNKLKL